MKQKRRFIKIVKYVTKIQWKRIKKLEVDLTLSPELLNEN